MSALFSESHKYCDNEYNLFSEIDETHGFDPIEFRKITVALVELFDVVSSF